MPTPASLVPREAKALRISITSEHLHIDCCAFVYLFLSFILYIYQ